MLLGAIYAITLHRFSETGFQFAARGIDNSWCRLRSRRLWAASSFRIAVHRFHLSGIQSVGYEYLEFAVAHVRKLEMSGSDLRALRRLSPRRKFVAQSGQRVRLCPLSRN